LPVFSSANIDLESDIFNTDEALPTRSESSTNMQHQLTTRMERFVDALTRSGEE
jgi:hypothetical protein